LLILRPACPPKQQAGSSNLSGRTILLHKILLIAQTAAALPLS
jgi:hypothetical protein